MRSEKKNEPCELFPVFAFQLTVGSNNNIIWRWANKVFLYAFSSGSVDANRATSQPSKEQTKCQATWVELLPRILPFQLSFLLLFSSSSSHFKHTIESDCVMWNNSRWTVAFLSFSLFAVCTTAECFSVNSQTNRQTNWQTSWWWWWWLPGCKKCYFLVCVGFCFRACVRLKPQSEMFFIIVQSDTKLAFVLSPHGSSLCTGESWQLAEKHPWF